MNRSTEPTDRSGEEDEIPRRVRRGQRRRVVLLGLMVAAVVGAFFAFKATTPPNAKPESRVAETPAAETREQSARVVPDPVVAPKLLAPVKPAPPTEPLAEPVVAQPGPRTARQLVGDLAGLNGTNGPITPEQAEKFKQARAELVRQGAASVPAIQELLAKNVDNDFHEVTGGEQMGYSSLRASLLDTLKEIGGPEAQEAMVQVLKTTAFPSELLEVSKNLENAAPGQYRDEIVKAARESLTMASANQLGNNVEIGPIFRILQNYGEESSTADAARNDPAKVENAIVMASLPDGLGLPSLIEMAQNSGGGSQTIATEMIAQMAGQNSQALDALTQMAEKGQISNSAWTRLAPILGGDQYQLGDAASKTSGGGNVGNGNYTVINGATTPEQINQRIGLIDSFLASVPADSAAAAALQQERGVLNAKLGK